MNRRQVLFGALAAPFAAGLAGCNTPVSIPVYPDITFQHKSPIRLDVRAIEVFETASTAPVEPPDRDIRYALPVSPLAAMQSWARDRLVAAGPAGIAQVTIAENRFVETPLDKTTGIKGLFTVDQSERYEGAMSVKLDIVGIANRSGFVEARAAATRTVPEDYSYNQREKALYDMVVSLSKALDERLEQEIRAKLPAFLV
jgi:hypothetical protein